MKKDKNVVAYFSMEYAFNNNLKTYAGGLGILAGDYLKGAKQFGYPIIGIGIKWKQGYGDQRIGSGSTQSVSYSENNYEGYVKDTGKVVEVVIKNKTVYCKIYKVKIKEIDNLYLLDTDFEKNEGSDRQICGQLYGWFGEERLAQEIILGVGGVRAMEALGFRVHTYHFNEGHAALAGLELIQREIHAGKNFKKALEGARKKIVFTTHTPVLQGNESHRLETMNYIGANLGLSIEEMVSLGGAPFNMTVAALRLSRKSNAVAQLHQKTAEKMWKEVKNREPIIGITNGIHIASWVDERMLKNFDNPQKIKACHIENKEKLIETVFARTGKKLDPNIILVGFSRRAVAYKRSTLIFANEKKADKLLKGNKIQLVFAGKPHPLDDDGKRIIQSLLNYQERYPKNVVFVQDYDMEVGKAITTGSDVWLNNPRVPLEACGTSGMKAAMNGVLNVSTLDGWFPEFIQQSKNGWHFGEGKTIEDFKKLDDLDKHDAACLYDCLFDHVVPTFYNHQDKWLKMMQKSISSSYKFFSIKRMLEEYEQKLYTMSK